LDLGQQLLNQTSQSQVVAITNNSSADLSFSAPPSISGPNAAEFTLVSACGATVAADSSCNVALSFTPTALGAASATLSFFDCDGDDANTGWAASRGTEPSGPARPELSRAAVPAVSDHNRRLHEGLAATVASGVWRCADSLHGLRRLWRRQ